MGSFGNTVRQWDGKIGNGARGMAAPTGSNLGLGNNVGGFIGGGGNGGGGQSGRGQSGASSMPGIAGGRFAGTNAVDYKRSFITTKKA